MANGWMSTRGAAKLLLRGGGGVQRIGLVALAIAGLVAAAACSGNSASKRPRSSLLEEATSTPTYLSPARWQYHPSSVGQLHAQHRLSEHEVLYAGEQGERWILNQKTRRLKAGGLLAPERLLAIVRSGPKRWLFLGKSGTTYEAEEPLGAFIRSHVPLVPLRRVAASRSGIVGVSAAGKLFRSMDGGVSWDSVGPKDPRFVDVAIDERGVALALASPERWYVSDARRTPSASERRRLPGGAQANSAKADSAEADSAEKGDTAEADSAGEWKLLDTPPLGAARLLRTKEGKIVVASVLGWHEFVPHAASPFRHLSAAPPLRLDVSVAPPRGPRAQAVLEGRAVVVGRRYLEIDPETPVANGSPIWIEGELGAALKRRTLPNAIKCRRVRLTAYADWVAIACGRQYPTEDAEPIEIWRSSDGGKTFHKDAEPLHAKWALFRFAVLPQGALLVSGTCESKGSDTDCSPRGIYYRRPVRKTKRADAAASNASKASKPTKPAEGTKRATAVKTEAAFEWVAAATPGLDGSAEALTLSADGRRVYGIGRRTKNGAYAVFVSSDGGKSFEARELDEVPAEQAQEHSFPPHNRSADGLIRASAAEDGTLALTFRTQSGMVLVVTDEQGRAVSVSRAPSEDALIAASGSRALAVSRDLSKAWESMDGGSSWDSVGKLPAQPCEGIGDCELQMVCFPAGCVLGNELSRIGWQGQLDRVPEDLSPRDREPMVVAERRVRTPLLCNLEEEEWHPLAGVTAMPNVADAAIGRVAWSVRASGPNASVSVVNAYAGTRPKVERSVLLPPVGNPAEMHHGMRPQIEGTVAYRFRRANNQLRVSELEVAWQNHFENTLERMKFDRSIVSPPASGPQLISIASGGVYWASVDGGDLYFLDGKRITQVPWISSARAFEGRHEMAHLGSKHVPFWVSGAIVATAQPDEGKFAARLLGLPQPTQFGVAQSTSLTYVAGRAALVIFQTSRGSEWPTRAQAFPLRADGMVAGPPSAVPTLLDVEATPRSCSERERETTPRIVASFDPGTRHPVILSHGIEPIRVFLTGDAVLYGTANRPCVAALEATLLSHNSSEEKLTALIFPGNLQNSWAFKQEEQQVSYRRISCHFDPRAPIPNDVYEESGTVIHRSL